MHCNVIVTNYNCRRPDVSQCNMKYSEVNQSMSTDNTTAGLISNEDVDPTVPVYDDIISTGIFGTDVKMEANPAYGGVVKMQPNPAYQDPTS